MSLFLYDQALTEKIKQWMPSTELQVYSPDDTESLFKITADKTEDKPLKLPIVCIRRNGGYTITNTHKQPLTYDGATKDATIEKSIQINAIPINIDYQVDIYTRYLKEADELARNFVFNLINFPKVTIEIPYNDSKVLHDSAISLAPEVSDNSDIPERMVKGQFTRFTLSFNIADAYIWDIRERDNYSIDALVDAK